MKTSDLLKDENGNNFIGMSNFPDWINFFFIFSRFEYGLKRAGYLKNTKLAEPDWKKFSEDNTVKKKFDILKEKSQELKKAIEYLRSKPPKKQIQDNHKLGWDKTPLSKEDFEGCIDAVKRVRNNLFHGGKFPDPGSVKDPSRNPDLIKHSITVLKYFLDSSPKVKEQYFGELG